MIKQPEKMPAIFIGHGSSMNTLESNHDTSIWRQFGQGVPRPRAIPAISAHWFISGTAVTAMAQPRVIHDFYGFPQALFDFDYPAPGAPDVAEEIAAMVGPTLCRSPNHEDRIGTSGTELISAACPVVCIDRLRMRTPP